MAKFDEDLESRPKLKEQPPDPIEICIAILHAYILRHQALPACMPPVPCDAAKWWLSRQEPETRIERPRQLPVIDNHKGIEQRSRWEAPYVLRVSQNLRKFLSLPSEQQRVILAAIEDGIPWRGDDYDRFIDIVDEYERMREIGVEEYRRQCVKRMKHAIVKVG